MIVDFINWLLTPLSCWIDRHEALTQDGWIEQPGYFLRWIYADATTAWFRRWRIPLRVSQPCVCKYDPVSGQIIFYQNWDELRLR
jgi:hypothetical protein